MYTLLHINEIVVPESIMALNYFPAWAVTVGQFKMSPIINLWVDDCPASLFVSSSLLEEGSSSLKDQSHHLILRKSLAVSPEWWPTSDAGSMRCFFPWMWLWCLLHAQFVVRIIRVSWTSWTRLASDHKVVMKMALAGRLSSCGWVAAVLVWHVPVRVSSRAYVSGWVSWAAAVIGWE